MMNVTVYHRGEPGLEPVIEDLNSLQDTIPHHLVIINLDTDPELAEKLGPQLPVIEVGPYRLHPPFNRQDLQIMLSAARDRIGQLERVDQEGYQQRVARGRKVSSGDRISLWLSRHYLAMVNVLIMIYVGLPFLAPVFMKAGQPFLASLLYKAYSPMCHQLAFRSWFLFGQQAYYPRELAAIPGVIPYEEIQNSDEIDLLNARAFLGNETIGYKVALCQRDTAIYLFMLLFGLAFWVSGRKFRSVPWYVWVVVGLVPIGLDGFSQLTSFWDWLPAWLPIRESTPLLRSLTGGLFGWMTAWYLIPMLEETARETRRIVQRKMAFVQQSNPAGRT